MKSEFRPSTPQDLPAISGLLQEIFHMPPGHPLVDPRTLQWKYWDVRDDFPGPRSFVVSAGSELLAHGALIPFTCSSQERQIRMVHLIDWVAKPTPVGTGVKILNQVAKLSDAMLIVGGSDMTRKILPALGFRAHGTATRFVRPLRPLLRLAKDRSRMRRRAIGFARSLAWSTLAPSAKPGSWNVRRIGENDLVAADIAWPKPRPDLAVLDRSAGMFRYMLRCPTTQIELYATERAWFLLSFAPAQARLTDCWIDSDDPADWRTLVQRAVWQAKQNRSIAEVYSVTNDPRLCRALSECGFHARGQSPIQVRAGDLACLPTMPIRVQTLDNDGAYLHEGVPRFVP